MNSDSMSWLTSIAPSANVKALANNNMTSSSLYLGSTVSGATVSGGASMALLVTSPPPPQENNSIGSKNNVRVFIFVSLLKITDILATYKLQAVNNTTIIINFYKF
jgi:hypothetical protein